jgi:glucokinase
VIAYDPEMVVLGGGVLRSKDVVLPALERHLRQHMPSLPLQTPIVHSILGDDAALLGGEVLMQQITAPFVT